MHPARTPLWRDVRILKWVLQVVVVGAVVAVLAWLYGNYTGNADRQNIPTSFDFLDNPTSFEITGNSLSPNAPVRDALYQGMLNTLRISVAGIVAATVLGTLVGIARLSSNWIVRRLATVYVELVRNVPLALFVTAGLLIVVLGGVNPNGGSGRLIGVVLAILILQILSSGLNMFPGISNFYRPLIWGGVLLAVIATNQMSRSGFLLRHFTRKGQSS